MNYRNFLIAYILTGIITLPIILFTVHEDPVEVFIMCYITGGILSYFLIKYWLEKYLIKKGD